MKLRHLTCKDLWCGYSHGTLSVLCFLPSTFSRFHLSYGYRLLAAPQYVSLKAWSAPHAELSLWAEWVVVFWGDKGLVSTTLQLTMIEFKMVHCQLVFRWKFISGKLYSACRACVLPTKEDWRHLCKPLRPWEKKKKKKLHSLPLQTITERCHSAFWFHFY